MATVTLEGISKYFGPVLAVQELSCIIAQGEFLALLAGLIPNLLYDFRDVQFRP